MSRLAKLCFSHKSVMDAAHAPPILPFCYGGEDVPVRDFLTGCLAGPLTLNQNSDIEIIVLYADDDESEEEAPITSGRGRHETEAVRITQADDEDEDLEEGEIEESLKEAVNGSVTEQQLDVEDEHDGCASKERGLTVSEADEGHVGSPTNPKPGFTYTSDNIAKREARAEQNSAITRALNKEIRSIRRVLHNLCEPPATVLHQGTGLLCIGGSCHHSNYDLAAFAFNPVRPTADVHIDCHEDSIHIANHEFVRPEEQSRIVFWTDASIVRSCGLGVVYKRRSRWNVRPYKVPGLKDIDVAEGVAIALALHIAYGELRGVSHAKVIVYKDSKVALEWLNDPYDLNGAWNLPVMYDILVSLERFKRNARDVSVEFRWVKGHVGVPGNELADKVSKHARTC